MAFGESEPTTTRSGFMKSSMAAPSFRNSGFETTSKGSSVTSRMASRTLAAVPTGTVDLSTTTRWPFMASPIERAAART